MALIYEFKVRTVSHHSNWFSFQRTSIGSPPSSTGLPPNVLLYLRGSLARTLLVGGTPKPRWVCVHLHV